MTDKENCLSEKFSKQAKSYGSNTALEKLAKQAKLTNNNGASKKNINNALAEKN
jgi:hypothetical protein